MIMPPAWRTRTTPRRRGIAASATFAGIVLVGGGLLWLVGAVLDGVGAPTWIGAAPWYLPTAAALVWVLRHPRPAVPTEDGDESWLVYSIRAVMVGVVEPRQRPARVVAAVLFGAPVAWSMVVIGALALAGIV